MSKLIDAAVSSLVTLENARSIEDFKRALPSFTRAQRDILLALDQNNSLTQEVQQEVAVVRKLATAGGDSSSLLSAISDLETAIGNIPAGANLAPLEAAVANLRVVANTISTGVTDIETDLTTARTELATIQNNLADASTDIDAVQSDLADAGTEIGVVKANLAVVRTEVGTVQTDLTGASTDITAIQASLAIVDTALTSIQSALNSNVADAIAAVQAAVDALPEGVDTAELNSAVTMLMSEISDVSTQVGTVKTVVDGTVTKVDSVKTVVDSTVTKVDDVKGVVDDTETKVDGVKTVVDSAETKVDGVKTVVDSTIDKVDDVKVVVDDAASKVDEVKVVVDGVPGNVTNARDHIENYENWDTVQGRLGEQPMIVASGRYLHEDSIYLGDDIPAIEGPTTGGIFSDGVTIWISDSQTEYAAFTLSTRARDTSKDVVLPSIVLGSVTYFARFPIYFDGTLLWVYYRSNSTPRRYTRRKINVSTGAISSAGTSYGTTDLDQPFGDGTYIWDRDGNAYNDTDNLVRNTAEDINFEALLDFPAASGNIRGRFVYSGVIYTIGRLSSNDRWDIFAVNRSTHGRDPCRDIRTLHINNNRDPQYLCIVNDKIYVADEDEKAIFVYQFGEKRVGFGRIIL